MKLNVINLGRCGYEEALKVQYDILEKRQQDEIDDTLILVEHPPVITMGRKAAQTNIVAPQQYLKDNGIELYETNRGGDVTYHGDGQIVGYPIFKLRGKGIGIREFVENLENTFVNILKKEYDIDAGKNPDHTGVWVGDNKIVAIGLAVKRGVTMHGFAYNVNSNLDHFKLIVPCGISDKGVTSVEKITGETIDFQAANKTVLEHFCEVFGYTDYECMELDDKR